MSDADRLDLIRAVGLRMRSELRGMLAQVPPEHTPISSLSRWLNVNRSVCHRVVAASRGERDAADVLRELPGLDGLDQFVREITAKGINRDLSDRGASAVAEYKRLIGTFGGSQSKLIRAIDALQAAERAGEIEDRGSSAVVLRQKWHDLAVELTGLDSEVLFGIHAVRTHEPAPRTFDWAGISGNLGVTRRPGHMPIIMVRRHVQYRPADAYRTLSGSKTEGSAPGIIIDKFSSRPLPEVVTRTYPTHLIQIIDPDQNAADPLDIVVGQRVIVADQEHRDRDGHRFTILPRVPARRVVLDIYMHDDFPRGPGPVARTFFAGTSSLAASFSDRWFDRLGDLPEPKPLGRNLADAESGRDQTHAAMTRWFFDELRWNPAEFSGYRLEIRLPLWSVEHALYVPRPFDPLGPEPDDEPRAGA